MCDYQACQAAGQPPQPPSEFLNLFIAKLKPKEMQLSSKASRLTNKTGQESMAYQGRSMLCPSVCDSSLAFFSEHPAFHFKVLS